MIHEFLQRVLLKQVAEPWKPPGQHIDGLLVFLCAVAPDLLAGCLNGDD